MRKLFAAFFVVALLAATFAPGAGAFKEDHPQGGGWGHGGVREKENCSPNSVDQPFDTMSNSGNGNEVSHACPNA
jgi:hypothetical protein